MLALDSLPEQSTSVAAPAASTNSAAGRPARRFRLGIAAQMALLKILLGVVTAIIVGVLIYNASMEVLIDRQQAALGTSLTAAAARVSSRYDTASRDALFLLNTPAILGFARAHGSGGGVDPQDGSTEEVARGRAAKLFAALIEARPQYFEVRFLDAHGNELVRVDRAADGSIRTAPRSDLRLRVDRPYFTGARTLPAGGVYVSDIDLNQEAATDVSEQRPAIRVSAPVYDSVSEQLAGVVVLNVDMQSLFDNVVQTLGGDTVALIANDSGDYLLSPDPAKSFAFIRGGRWARIQDDFPALEPVVKSALSTYSGVVHDGARTGLVAAASVGFDLFNPGRHIVVAGLNFDVVPAGLALSAALPVAAVAAVILLMGVITALVLVWAVVRPLRRMTGAAVSLAAGDRNVDISALSARNDEIGDLAKAVTVMVAKLSEREDRLTAQARELTRSNQELAQFAYVASHDLQEPLRMVGSYLELLSRRYEGKLDNEAQEFIGFAVDGATRMKRLINDLLGYSRAGSNPLKRDTVELAEVVKATLATLALNIAEAHATVEVGPMPTVIGDPAQLGRVFQNLIENALKYRSSTPPRIRIAAEATTEGWRISVADNGIGIDPRFNKQIFEIFKRLHGRDQYSGTGIGLAVTKLVVERHGGQVWVEPAAGGGSIFTFTLPQRRAAA